MSSPSITQSSSSSSSIRVVIVKNGEPKSKGKIVVLKPKFEELLKNAKNKLRMKKVNRIFNVSQGGTEIKDNDEDLHRIKTDDILAFSFEKDFIDPNPSQQTNHDPYDSLNNEHSEGKNLEGNPSGDCNVVKTTTNPSHSDKNVIAVSIKKTATHENENVVVRSLIEESWIDDDAYTQLKHISKVLPGVKFGIGMPDLHPGKGFPIGAVFAVQNIIYPSLIGTDIGCGMSLFETNVSQQKVKLDKWVNRLRGLEGSYDGIDVDEWRQKFNVKPTAFDSGTLGTIGGGNHFAELQEVHKVLDASVFEKEMGLNPDALYLLVHSGSRGLGYSILSEHEKLFGPSVGFEENSKEAREYLEKHDNACSWAKLNRHLIAHRFTQCLNMKATCKIDIWHNNVCRKKFDDDGQELWVHRKGAAPADLGPVVIPGSRGSFSYLVQPTSKASTSSFSGYSLAHGAGRKWNRQKALHMGKHGSKISLHHMATTDLGSRVICEDNDLMFEEMPSAYKDVDQVIADLQHFECVKVIAIFKPLITYKTRKEHFHK